MAITTTMAAFAAAEELERILAEAATVVGVLAAYYEEQHGPDDLDARQIHRLEREARAAERTVSYRTRVLRELAQIEANP